MRRAINCTLLFLLITTFSGCDLLGIGDGDEKTDPLSICSNAVNGMWTSIGLEDEYIYDIAVHPEDPGYIIAGSWPGSIYRTTDCGENWNIIWDDVRNGLVDIEIHPDNPDVVYATPGSLFESHRVNFIRSTDGGDTWQEADEGLPEDSYIRTFSGHPDNPDQIFATAGNSPAWLYFSVNGGGTWQMVPGYNDPDREEDDNHLLRSHIRNMIIHPTDPNQMFISRTGILLQSKNGGMNWQRIFDGNEFADGLDLEPLAFNHDNTKLLAWFSVPMGQKNHGLIEYSLIDGQYDILEYPDFGYGHSFTIGEDHGYLSADGIFDISDWSEFNEGLPHHVAQPLIHNDYFLYAGLGQYGREDGGVYIRLIE